MSVTTKLFTMVYLWPLLDQVTISITRLPANSKRKNLENLHTMTIAIGLPQGNLIRLGVLNIMTYFYLGKVWKETSKNTLMNSTLCTRK